MEILTLGDTAILQGISNIGCTYDCDCADCPDDVEGNCPGYEDEDGNCYD